MSTAQYLQERLRTNSQNDDTPTQRIQYGAQMQQFQHGAQTQAISDPDAESIADVSSIAFCKLSLHNKPCKLTVI